MFNQMNIAGETKIRHSENMCKKIQGYDAISLYPYYMQQFLPVNCWYRQRADESYKACQMDGFNQRAFEIEFLTCMNHVHKQLNYPPIKSKHTEGGRESIILGFRVDGCCEPILKVDDLSEDDIIALKQIGSYDKPTIYEAVGCYFHGCVHIIKQRLDALKKCTIGTEQKKLVSEIRLLLQHRYDMQHKPQCLEEAGYYVYSMTECRWHDEIKNLSFADVDNGNTARGRTLSRMTLL